MISLVRELDLSPDHVYSVKGERVPGVTSVLAAERLIDARFFTEESRHRGTAVHAAVEQDERQILDEAFLDPRILGYLEGWRAFVRDKTYKTATLPILGDLAFLAEVRMLSKVLGVAGTADGIGTMKGITGLTLVDVKSGVPSPATSLQTAAYAALFHELTGQIIAARYAVEVRANGTYRLHRYQDMSDIHVFKSILNLHRWRQRHVSAYAAYLEAA
jgi:hypothetical protein